MKATPIRNTVDELPRGWAQTTLGDVADRVQYGTSAKTGSGCEGVPVIRMGNIADGRLVIDKLKYLPADHKDFPDLLLAQGDVLFNRTNSAELVGKTAVYHSNPNPCSFASYLIRVRLGHGYNPELLAYYINSCFGRAWIGSVVSQQVGQANVNGSKLQALCLPVPPLQEQHRIVAEIEKQFTRLDAALESLKRIRANLKRYRASVLRAACEGHLVPTEAELARAEGRDYEPAAVLLERIIKERPDNRAERQRKNKEEGNSSAPTHREPVETGELGSEELPEGWSWSTINHLSELVTKGSSPKWQGFNYCDDGIVFVRSQNVGWGRLVLAEVAHLPEAFNRKEKKSLLQVGDVLLNIVGASIGRAAVASEAVKGGNVNQAVAVVRPIVLSVSSSFLVNYLISSTAQARIHSEKVDVARANVSLEDVKNLPVPLPPLSEQQRIVEEIERRFSVTEEIESRVEANLKRSERLRQSILKRAFEGKLVPQDPNDEAASVLLERIRAERKARGESAASRKDGDRVKRKRA